MPDVPFRSAVTVSKRSDCVVVPTRLRYVVDVPAGTTRGDDGTVLVFSVIEPEAHVPATATQTCRRYFAEASSPVIVDVSAVVVSKTVQVSAPFNWTLT